MDALSHGKGYNIVCKLHMQRLYITTLFVLCNIYVFNVSCYMHLLVPQVISNSFEGPMLSSTTEASRQAFVSDLTLNRVTNTPMELVDKREQVVGKLCYL